VLSIKEQVMNEKEELAAVLLNNKAKIPSLDKKK
jgi:hypothetical protein